MKGNKTPTDSSAIGMAISVGLMLGTLALHAGATYLPNRGVTGWLQDAIAVSRGRDLPGDRWSRAETAGYYERLLNGADEMRDQSLVVRLWKGKPADKTDPYVRGGFLIYEPKPLLSLATSEDGNFVTNSHGLIDREHTEAKPPNTVRIAFLGDSQARGRGLPDPNQQRFETLLEQRLNSSLPKHVEVLNFAVSGYRPTQMYYVATEKALVYHPDLFLLTVTPLGIGATAGAHLGEVVREGIDPRYDFMRQTLKAAGVHRNDSYGLAQMKVAPYRLSLLREVLSRLKSQTTEQGATFAVVLLPAAEVPSVTATRFEGIRELVEGVGVPIIDLLDTYDQVRDIETVRLNWSDDHPNAAGHQLLAQNLDRKLRSQRAVWSALTGPDQSAAVVNSRDVVQRLTK